LIYNIYMHKYKLVKLIGQGVFGYIFKARYNKEFFALKIQKIKESDKIVNYNSKVWREIEFSNFSKLYPEQFCQLFEYKIITNKEDLPKQYLKDQNDVLCFSEILKFDICIIFIYKLKENTFDKIYKSLSKKQLYSAIIQIIFIIYLLKKNNYMHCDLHNRNIMFSIVPQSYKINMLNYSIPTFGYLFCFIDFGSLLNPKYDLNDKETLKLKNYYSDLDTFFNNLRQKLVYDQYKNKINYYKVIKQIKKEYQYNKLNKYLIQDFDKTNLNIIYNLFLTLNEVKLAKILKINKYPIEKNLEKSDYKCMWYNIHNPELIMNYFYKKLIII
jgi:hypothetical protein